MAYGEICLCAVIALVLVGFALGKKPLSVGGAISLYLPTFGYFACSMFFLAGIGVLRVLWMPLLAISQQLLELGSIAYLPLLLAELLGYALGGWSAAHLLAVAYAIVFVLAGLGVFALGVFSWLYGRFVGAELVDFLAYGWSRPPQYLGYILWSYGFSIYAGLQPAPRGGALPPSLSSLAYLDCFGCGCSASGRSGYGGGVWK